MKKNLFVMALFALSAIGCTASAENPVAGLLERIDKGASRKFEIEVVAPADGTDFFELDQDGRKVVVRGNNYVSIATGINWYLKYHAGVHLSWNGMTAELPDELPPVKQRERHETSHTLRYYLNYCTYSYSMAFWDWERWQREIDWMAMHGINLSLAITGTEAVWRDMLLELGYTRDEINEFIAGPAFLAWWQMNNLEGWGGPNPDSWYAQQEELQKKIIARMREYGIEPVLPGYAGMAPRNIGEKIGVEVTDPGLWCGFPRPAFIQPTDKDFNRIADLYYAKLTELYGAANYYAIDPFHEGGSTEGVDLDLTGKAIMGAMKKVNPDAVWVAQAWGANPRPEMIGSMRRGDLLVLDLFSESRPMWGGMEWSAWHRPDGYGQHDWIYCMLLNFGGRTGLHGKMTPVIDNYYDAVAHRNGETLQGVGATMEAIENNPVMYELLYELPWRAERFTAAEWLEGYVGARYGRADGEVVRAWDILSKTVYNCPSRSTLEGTVASVFAANPSLNIRNVSCCSIVQPFYDTDSVRMAAEAMLSVAEQYRGNNNFEYDLVDIVRQTVANRAYYLQLDIAAAFNAGDKASLASLSARFLDLLMAQDRLLETRPEFMLGTWTGQARKIGAVAAEKDLYEWNARTQITVWGNRSSAGMLHNYAYKEWSGVLRDVYYPRWEAFLVELAAALDEGREPRRPDYFGMDEEWCSLTGHYPSAPSGNAIDTATEVYETMVK